MSAPNRAQQHDFISTLQIISNRAEEKFTSWLTLLPEELRDDVYGVPWSIILSSIFFGSFLLWIIMWRMGVSNRKNTQIKNEKVVLELQSQLESLLEEKVNKEKQLQENLVQVENNSMVVEQITADKEAALRDVDNLKKAADKMKQTHKKYQDMQNTLEETIKTKDQIIQDCITSSRDLEKSSKEQNVTIAKLQSDYKELENSLQYSKKESTKYEETISKLKERLKESSKHKTEVKDLSDKMKELENEVVQNREHILKKEEEVHHHCQEIDVLKDCLLQFRAFQKQIAENGENLEDEESLRKQKDKLSSMVDVSRIKTEKKAVELEKEQLHYELEAEKKAKEDIEERLTEMNSEIENEKAMKINLRKEKQELETKISVMQKFYAQREVEIQGKLGKEQTMRENNETLIAHKEKFESEMSQQLDAYKQMSAEAKQQYEEAERLRKTKTLEYEKKAHENWLACREAERKYDESTKEITQLKMELNEMQRKLREAEERPMLYRPQPTRREPFERGSLPSPVHFRNGPPSENFDPRVSASFLEKRPTSPGGSSITDESGRPLPGKQYSRPQSRPDRPPSTHSLPGLDGRPHPHLFGPGPNMDRRPLGMDRGPPLLGDRRPGDGMPPMHSDRGPPSPGDKGPPMPGDRGPPMPGDRGPPMPGDRGPPMPGDRGPPMPGDRGPPMYRDRGPPMPGDRGPPKPMPGDRGPPRMPGSGPPMPRDRGPPPPMHGRGPPPPMSGERGPPMQGERGPPLMHNDRPPFPMNRGPPMHRDLPGRPPSEPQLLGNNNQRFNNEFALKESNDGPLTSSPYMARPQVPEQQASLHAPSTNGPNQPPPPMDGRPPMGQANANPFRRNR